MLCISTMYVCFQQAQLAYRKIFLDKEGGMNSAMKVQTVEFEKTEE